MKIKFIALKFHFLIILIAFVTSIILTWPFITRITSYYPSSGDYSVNGSILKYNYDSLLNGKFFNQKEYFNGYQLYPQAYTLAYSDHRFMPSIIFIPIYFFSKNLILSVNLVTFLTFVFSFISSFYVIKAFTKNSLASIFGASIYAFNPLTFSHFPVHLDLLNKYFLPTLFLFAYKFLSYPNLKNSFLFFLFFTLNSLSAVYFQIFSFVAIPLFSLPFFIYKLKNLKYFLNIIKFSLIGIIFILPILYINIPYLNFSRDEITNRTIKENVVFSARIIDFLGSNPDNLIYGEFTKNLEEARGGNFEKQIGSKFNYPERTLFLNIVPLLFFLIALYIFLKSCKRARDKLMIYSLSIVLFASFIFTFGPYFLGWDGNFLSDPSDNSLKLPFYYFYYLSPFLKAIRAPIRFEFLFYVPFSIFASFGFLFFLKRVKKAFRLPVLFLFLIFLFLENFNIRSYEDKSLIFNSANNFFSKTNVNYLKEKAVLHLPIYIPNTEKDSMYLNWQVVTGEKILNGGSGYMPMEQALFLIGLKDKSIDDIAKEVIPLDVNYIIIHNNLLKKPYKVNDSLIKYRDKNISVLDLKRYNLNIKKCDFEKDIETDLRTNAVSNYFLVLKNKQNCYYPSIYNAKYQAKDFQIGSFFGGVSQHRVYFKLPVIIKPYEEIILSQQNNDFKIN